MAAPAPVLPHGKESPFPPPPSPPPPQSAEGRSGPKDYSAQGAPRRPGEEVAGRRRRFRVGLTLRTSIAAFPEGATGNHLPRNPVPHGRGPESSAGGSLESLVFQAGTVQAPEG